MAAASRYSSTVELTLKAEAEWKVHCTVNGHSQTSLGVVRIHILQAAWLRKRYPGKFDSMNLFNETKSTAKALKRMKCYDEVRLMLGNLCNFTAPDPRNKDLVYAMHALVVLFDKTFRGSMGIETLQPVLCDAVKLCLPIGETGDSMLSGPCTSSLQQT